MLLLCLLLAVPASCKQLLFVHALWRHGNRSPTHSFPTDYKNTAKWPQGLGQLTEGGMWQHYELGQILASKYKETGFLDDYDARQIYVRSTDWNRTLMSGYSNLAGMYNETALNKTDWPQPWNPIPVHTINRYYDSVLWTDIPCPKADDYKENVVHKFKNWRKIEDENKELFQWLADKMGSPISLGNISSLADILRIEKREKFPWLSWMNESLFEEIDALSVEANKFRFEGGLTRLRGGNLLGEMLNRMSAKAKCQSDCQWLDKLKYYAYSAHDTTVYALLSALGAREEIQHGLPGLASCVLMELWKNASGHFVKVLYRDNTTQEFHPVTIEGCDGQDCPLETFRKRSQPYIPDDWEKECGLTPPKVTSDEGLDAFKIATIVLGIVCGLLLCIVIGLIFQLKRSGKMGGKSDNYPM